MRAATVRTELPPPRLREGDLSRRERVEDYLAAFHAATGIPVGIKSPNAGSELGQCANPFCALVCRGRWGHAACEAFRNKLEAAVEKGRASCQANCFAGLTECVAPIRSHDQRVATLWAGQVLCVPATEQAFRRATVMVAPELRRTELTSLREAYFATYRVAEERWRGAVQLLELTAAYLAGHFAIHEMPIRHVDPMPVVRAKRFIGDHFAEPITLAGIADHAHVNRYYLCRLFKKHTGVTVTEFLARTRVERAQAFLVQGAGRVTRVVDSAGFGSLPHFYHVFKRYVGMAPTQYRKAYALASDDLSTTLE